MDEGKLRLSSLYRTHTCCALGGQNAGERVRLSGWVHRKRDHGGVIFVDLRDHYGVVQLVFMPDAAAGALEVIEKVSAESVVRVEGRVVARDAGAVNPDLATGQIEVLVDVCDVLSPAGDLPLPVFGEPEYPEDVRLKYRFLELRRERLHRHIVMRSRVIAFLRRRMIELGFHEYQTPILTASSPEGARDFLVPSRLHPGKFYALPQAPQLFKQLVMIAGFDRYFQIAPCFRDEDARSDRSPGDFYQLDIEMSFVEQEDIFNLVEPLLVELFTEFSDRPIITVPFERLSHQDALALYGTDKPDLRNPIRLIDLTELFSGGGVRLRVFLDLIEKGCIVRGIPAPRAAAMPRSFFDRMDSWAKSSLGAKGLGYLLFREENGRITAGGTLAKFVDQDVVDVLVIKHGCSAGDALFFVCDGKSKAECVAHHARMRIGRDLGLTREDAFAFCWITDFPFYEWNSSDKRIDFSHNPFSMPKGGLDALNTLPPLEIKAWQYDIVCNGVELSSGAIRNHSVDIMVKAFDIAGYSRKDISDKFPGIFDALHYGAPPHGGIAPGIDRMLMLLLGTSSLRDVVMFPLNQRGEDTMMNAPASVSEKQLRELGLRVPK